MESYTIPEDAIFKLLDLRTLRATCNKFRKLSFYDFVQTYLLKTPLTEVYLKCDNREGIPYSYYGYVYSISGKQDFIMSSTNYDSTETARSNCLYDINLIAELLIDPPLSTHRCLSVGYIDTAKIILARPASTDALAENKNTFLSLLKESILKELETDCQPERMNLHCIYPWILINLASMGVIKLIDHRNIKEYLSDVNDGSFEQVESMYKLLVMAVSDELDKLILHHSS